MATEQYHEDALMQNDLYKVDNSSLNKWKSVSTEVKETDGDHSTSFDCNICLDSVQDPVVTLCGHLYCWPCIYKWINFQRISGEYFDKQQQQQAQCPVCKTKVSSATLVPLYGRGQMTIASKAKAPHLDLIVPRRPSGPRRETLSPFLHPRSSNHQSPMYNLRAGGNYYSTPPSLLNSGVSTTASTFNPIIGMLSEMVYTKMFGNSVTNIYTYPNSYNLGGGASSPRMRRREMQADKSLSRICFFLLCCMIFCLICFD